VYIKVNKKDIYLKDNMALLDLLKTGILGFKGNTPEKRAGAFQDKDIHVKDGVHTGNHTNLDRK
jgi:hypothetical protein